MSRSCSRPRPRWRRSRSRALRRPVTALNLRRGSTARVFYLVRAVTPGTYTVPPPLAEDMYRPDLRGVGRSSPSTITVVQP